jgi:DNA-binding CsgD family transcriptional regulator
VAVRVEPHHGAGHTEVRGQDDPGPLGEEVERGDEVGGVVDSPAGVRHADLVGRVGGADVCMLVQRDVAVVGGARQAQERESMGGVLGDDLCAEEVAVEAGGPVAVGDIEGDVVQRDGDHRLLLARAAGVFRLVPAASAATVGPGHPSDVGDPHPPHRWDVGLWGARGTINGVWSELRAERVRREIAAACAAPFATLELLDVVAGLVDEAVPADAACWSTFDPATTMVTSAIGRDLDEHGDAAARFFELEYAVDAPGQYRSLVETRSPTVVLDADMATRDHGAAVTSEHLQSMGVQQELRVLLHDHGVGWGGAGLMRASGSSAFTTDESAFLELIAPTIAQGVRAALIRGASTDATSALPGGPAVLVLERDGVVEATPAAAAWLDRLLAVDRGHGEVPTVVQAVAASATAGRTVAQRARTADASWVVLRGAPLGPGRAVVTIEPAAPPEVTSLIGAALGLTGREAAVVTEVLRGLSTKEIASALNLSPYTVQDHLKSVFAKAGVNSRRALVADVFFGIYAPRLGAPVGPDGFFTASSSPRTP